MKENLIKFAQQGVWASLSGGWYYDSRFSSFTNLFHLYIWLFLLSFPFLLYLITPLDFASFASYIAVLLVFFCTLKAVNSYLHHTFDCGNQVQKEIEQPAKGDSSSTQKDVGTSRSLDNHEGASLDRVVEETLVKSLDSSNQHESDDVAGHKKLWDDIEAKDVAEWMKEDLDGIDPDFINFKFDGWPQAEEKQDLEQKEVFDNLTVTSQSTQVRTEDELKPAAKLQKVKQAKRRKKGAPVDRCVSITSLSSSEYHSDEPQTSSSEENVAKVRRAFSQGTSRMMQRRVGFRSHVRPTRFSKRPLTHVEEQSGTDRTGNGADAPESSKSRIEVDVERNPEKKVNDRDVTEGGGDAEKTTVIMKKMLSDSDIPYKLDVEAFPPEEAVARRAQTSSMAALNERVLTISCTSLTSATTPSGGSLLDEIEKMSRHGDGYGAEHRAAVLKAILDSNHAAQKIENTDASKRNDGTNVPLLPSIGATEADKEVKPKKRVTLSHSAPTEIVEKRGSSPSSDSDTRNVDENYRQCLQNFQKIPQISRSDRSRSTSSARQRHPAGDPFQHSFAVETKARLRSADDGDEPGPSGLNRTRTNSSVGEGVKLHLAADPSDTSEGAVHGYQGADGKFYAYAFTNESGSGLQTQLDFRGMDPLLQLMYRDQPHARPRVRSRRRTGGSSSSTSTSRMRSSMLEEWELAAPSISPEPATERRLWSGSRRSQRLNRFSDRQFLANALQRSIDNRQRMPGFDSLPSPLPSQLDLVGRTGTPKVKLYYKVKTPLRTFTMQYDRLALMDLLDRNFLTTEAILSVILAAVVGLLGLLVLSSGLLHDIWTFWFCFVIAASQYSMVKSVQPDSASPTHGYNKLIAYSRPIYFIICASLLLLCNFLSLPSNVILHGVPFYGLTLFNNTGFAFATNFMIVFTLLLPLIFLFGLLPQVNTFLIYSCEQCEIHIFGGTASTSVPASLFSIGRSITSVLLLYGFCYGALSSQEKSQNILFSAFCGLLVSFSYHLSRQTSSPVELWSVIKTKLLRSTNDEASDDPSKNADAVSKNYHFKALTQRLESDVILLPVISVLAFALHSTSLFTSFRFPFTLVLLGIISILGCVIHYVVPQLRKSLPWLLFAKPILKSHEYHLFEVTKEAKLMWYETAYTVLCFIERNLLLPIYIMNELTKQTVPINDIYGQALASVVITVVGMKLLRSAYSVPGSQYLIYLFSYLFVNYDNPQYKDFVLITYFITGILFVKLQELVLKLHFFMVYISPWQMSWGSTFHAFAQPFAVPHSAIMLVQALIAALLQAPFVPFLGSAIFHSSYVRPLKFWEKNYNTKRVDHSNTRLANQLERGPQPDDNNLNSVFYEHLTYSLQKSLAGDIALGRWGNVYPGDCFILASDYLNAMVHIVEVGNGLITFQLRGLEFSGTYCQQREVEAINEAVDSNEYCCCCYLGKIKGMLSFNSAFNQRWLAWQVVAMNYVLDGYSITDNNATTMLGVFDLRKILVSYIVKSIVYFLITHDSLDDWLENSNIRSQIEPCEQSDYVEVDATFAVSIDDDFDTFVFGLTRGKFVEVYGSWIDHCVKERKKKKQGKELDSGSESKLITLCFVISVLGRRALGTASNNLSSNLDCFLYGLHALFKGDFRITSSKDEWVFNDMSLLQQVVAPGVRTALKLHQDHFTSPDEYEEDAALYDAISEYTNSMVIAHEADPVWRTAVLSNTPSLLALRRVASDSYVDQYSVVTLNHRSLGFNLVRINKECVRGLWAGQQSELIFLRNRNPERGSIQNAKQVLRNMINSSCDQPIGYPIYVSPLTTSFASTNQQYMSIVKGPLTFQAMRSFFQRLLACLRESCTGSCNSGASGGPAPPIEMTHFPPNRGMQAEIGRSSRASERSKAEYFTTTLTARSERGSGSSSQQSSQPISDAHVASDVSHSSTSSRHQAPLPSASRFSLTGSRPLESSNMQRSRPMSNSMNLPQTSHAKKASHSASALL